jgi:NitT/TauT family transport system substrate-binding protein
MNQASLGFFRMAGMLGVCIFAAMTLNACDRSNGASQGGEKPVTVRLGYFANLTHAQAVLGVASGEFEKSIAPHTLKPQVFNAGPSMIEALFAGEIDIGYIGPGPALSGFEKSRGEGLHIIAGAATNGVVVVARADSGINSMADLKGKRIATPQLGNTQDIAARHYLIHELKQENADNVLPIANAEQLAMMSRGQIDAAWSPEPWSARLVAEAGAKIIAEEKDLWPDKQFMLTVVIVRPEFAARHPDIVENILRAHISLTKRFQTDARGELDQLGEALYVLTQKRLERSTLEQAMSRIGFTDQPHRETFNKFGEWAMDLGFAKAKPDVNRLIDTSILERARLNPALPGRGAGKGGS